MPGNLIGLEAGDPGGGTRLLQLDGRAKPADQPCLRKPTHHPAVRCPRRRRELAATGCGVQPTGSAPRSRRMLPGTACASQPPACWRKLWPVKCQPSAAKEQRLPQRPVPSPAAVAAPAYASKSCPTCGGSGGPSSAGAGTGPAGAAACRVLLLDHTTLHARAHDPGWNYCRCLLPQPEAPFSRP